MKTCKKLLSLLLSVLLVMSTFTVVLADTETTEPEFTYGNIALDATESVLGAPYESASRQPANINNGVTISPSAAGDGYVRAERVRVYVKDLNSASIDETPYKEGYVHYSFGGKAKIEGFKFYEINNITASSTTNEILKVVAKDKNGNVLASYDCANKSGYSFHDGYARTYAHTAVKFDEFKTLNEIFIYYYIAGDATKAEVWLAEVEVFGELVSEEEELNLVNVASAENGGSVHANLTVETTLDGCLCDPDINNKGIFMSKIYINDGAKGTATINPDCQKDKHRYISGGASGHPDQYVELTFGFEQMTTLYSINLCAKSTKSNGHISTIEVVNKAGQVVGTFNNTYTANNDKVDYTYDLAQPLVTDSVVLRFYPNTAEGFTQRIELWEVEILGVPATFDIDPDTKLITAEDISSAQNACLLVATYEDASKKELKSVEIVNLVDGKTTKDMSDYSNYKVFFLNGVNVASPISHKVIEG